MANCPTDDELEGEGGVTVQLRAFCPEDQEHGQTLHPHRLPASYHNHRCTEALAVHRGGVHGGRKCAQTL